MISLELAKMTVKLLTTEYNALLEKKKCLIRQQTTQISKNSEESISSI